MRPTSPTGGPGPTGGNRQGGGGLHRSRGGTRATPADPTAPTAAARATLRQGRPGPHRHPRPRYLDEDEPTPPREIPPSVIE
ncbi:hypothetical protein O1L55_22075 [Streptomyces albulus]|nr:hypothetical protein [Streptomyces noursei]